MMQRLLLLDDAAAVNNLFAELLRRELHVEVVPLAAVADLEYALEQGERYDFALVDLSFPEEGRNGLDALLALHLASSSTQLAVITQGDSYVADLLRDVWELLPVATVISKAAPIEFQLRQIREFILTGSAPLDPSVQPLLPTQRSSTRTLESFQRLVTHAGHVKLWEALLAAPENVSYNDIVTSTDLRLNTVKNYRAQLLPELANHCPADPSLRELREFAVRCRPVLERCLTEFKRRSKNGSAT